MNVEAVAAEGIAPPAGHYSHGLVVEASRWLFVAGQVALDADGNLVGGDDAEAQADQVLFNMGKVIESAGGSLSGVVKCTVYLVNLADRPAVARARKRFFPDPAPANTLVVVTSLAQPELLVEIDAIVALP